MKYEVVLLDFDGTLMDTSEGILRCLTETFADLELPVPPMKTLRRFMGPPLYYSFRTFAGMEDDCAIKAVELFRGHYAKGGVYQSKVYDGLESVIRRLRSDGVKVGVATLKPEFMANLLLKHFEIDELIDVCSGSISDEVGSATKAMIIEEALARIGYTDKSRVVLVGDTAYDADGAQEAGIDFIAAAYGFGIGPEQRDAAHCVCTVENAAELERFFFA